MSKNLRNPLFATLALLLAGTAFAAVILIAYPGDDKTQSVPTVKAEQTAFKTQPENAGGMQIPHSDSTVFETTRSTSVFGEGAPVEDLLAQDDATEEPVSKLEAFAKEAEEIMGAIDSADESEDITETSADQVVEAAEEAADETITEDLTAAAEEEEVPAVQTIKQEVVKIPPKDLLSESSDAAGAKTATTAQVSTQTPPDTLYKPGGSPETIAFVRSVLDKKDTRNATNPAAPVEKVESVTVAGASPAPAPETLSRVEPAAGAATPSGTSVGGNYFVQVASVTSPGGAEIEWSKIEKTFVSLSGVPHRVKEANLGERGTYYRIQAGPFSKDQANSICESIKAQKPGGCLVVK